MAEAKSVPALFVKDPIVLPGMVVPVALDDAARAAVDAARATESGKLLRLAAQVGKKYGYYGAWQIAVVTTGLDGATSSKTVDSWGDPGPIYTEPTYGKATEATFTELDTEPDNVTARLVLRLLRSLGAHSHPDYQHLSPVS
jgi:hypothetical protein